MHMTIQNAMTIDVEDYFQVSAFEQHIPRSEWQGIASRLERNMERILAMLDQRQIKATFFMLGWLAERYPQVVRSIVDNGHELASHGYQHIRVTSQTPSEFQQDVIRTKGLLEDVGGVDVKGYRAASYSIGEDNLWAHEKLLEAGHSYSSSIYPIRHDHYGMRSAPRFSYRPFAGEEFVEIPITTTDILGIRLPGGGGGYFRLLPYWMSRKLVQRVNDIDGQPAIFYFHPWEIDADQPRQQDVGLKTKFRHYLNLKRMEARLERLFADFEWDRMDRIFL
jgi:polysaccharide deacetylase family protein (PEP-CTERM system associated)